ncbi:protein G12 [Drosophila subpulchrella]|uniref:protein G12 n=1 Tax=Drosophila subpulchrella TaxID=1486046 RepID=UPI0018A17299|nr:protein G12 [Drosophila subpulchrella]
MAFSTSVSVIFGISAIFCWVSVSGDLRADLKDFVALVPRRRIGFIAARYYIFDPKFRQAVEFVRSDEFTTTWKQIRAAPDFVDIINYVTEYGSGYDITTLVDSLPTRLQAYQLSRTVPVELMLRRDLTTFLRDVIQSLPRTRIYSLMSQKMRQSSEFARLYKALRNKEFKELVQRARRSEQLKAPIRKLNQKSINVDELLQILFEVISWGPQIS